MPHLKDLKETIALYGADVARNLTIIEKGDLTLPFLLRVDIELPKTFVPRMPMSAADSENSTVPRVVTADTLMGCICGHSDVFYPVKTRSGNREFRNNAFKITHFDFDYALKPTPKLVFDADETGEIWLVTYDKATIQYHAVIHGEFFVNKISIHPRGAEKLNHEFAEICIRITDTRGLMLTPKIHLERGCHYVKINITNYALGQSLIKETKLKRLTKNADAELSVMPIKENVYQSFRMLAVGTKSH